MNKRRVVITGIGAVTPLGTGVGKSWQALCQGKSGVARITKFDTSGFKCQIAAEVKDFHPEDFLDKKKIRGLTLLFIMLWQLPRWLWTMLDCLSTTAMLIRSG